MTTQVQTNPSPETATETPTEQKPPSTESNAIPETNQAPTDNKQQQLQQQQQQQSNHQTEDKPQSPGVFGGWGFDVNAVTGNLGAFFTAADPSVPDDVAVTSTEHAEHHEHTEHGDPAQEISATAANLAKTATTEFENASKAAQKTIGKAAEEIGKGWGTLNTFLDDMLAAKSDAANADPESDADALKQFRQLFPELEADDQLVDHFKCSLLQKYRCYLNNATPEKTFVLKGRLFVSTSNIAMYVMDEGGEFGGQPFGISMPFTDIAKIQKGAKAMIRVVTKSQSSLIFGHFESDSHFSGALSLLEHMVESGAQPQGQGEKETQAVG